MPGFLFILSIHQSVIWMILFFVRYSAVLHRKTVQSKSKLASRLRLFNACNET